MTTYDLRKKTDASSGQRIISLGNNNDARVAKLENRINDQEQKLDKILKLLQHGNNISNTNE